MIRRLIILLLIVGCAPTTATFYIGMTEKEFNKEIIKSVQGRLDILQKGIVSEENSVIY